MQGQSRRIGLVAALAMLTALLVAGGVAHGRLISYLTAKVSKHADGPFSAEPIHATVGSKARSFYVRAENNNPSAKMQVQLTDASFAETASDYRIRWYRGEHDITQSAHSTDGYVFKLAAQSNKVFRAKVKPRVSHPGGLCLVGEFTELHPNPGAIARGFFYINSDGICDG
jgi:hypothetical protein